MKTSEKYLEHKLRNEVKAKGGLAPKLMSPSMNGLPDRMILMPNGKLFFVELKSKGKKPSPIQTTVINQLTKMGFKCFVIDSPETLDNFLNNEI